MSNTESHYERVREQFNRHGEAYAKFSYVSDEAGLKSLVKATGATPNQRVLDVACGPGHVAIAFAKACKEAIGIDATDRFIQMARSEAGRQGVVNARFVQGDVNKMEFADASFDIAVCRAAFHHFPEPERVLGEMKRVVKRGGRLLILDMVASEEADKAAYHHEIETLCDPTHVRALSTADFETLFKEHGLEVLSRRDGETKYPVDAWIEHGGPPLHNRDRILRLLEACLESDRAGIPVWRSEEGTLWMAHPGVSYLLNRA